MTSEEAIDVLKHPDEMYHGTDGIVGYTFNPNGRNYEAFRLAIKALEQEPSKDTISRKKLIKDLNFLYNEDGHIKDLSAKRTMEVIMEQSPVSPQESILDKIREEMDGLLNDEDNLMYAHGVMDCLEIIDKYKAEEE